MQSNLTTKKLEQLAPELLQISDRIKGCAGMIESLANCERLYLGFRGMDVHSAKRISQRLCGYADCWRVVAKHITTPEFPLSETCLDEQEKSQAMAWICRGGYLRPEVAALFETYAEYLPPCLLMLRAVSHKYDDAPRDTEEARTAEAVFLIEQELEALISDIDPLIREVHRSWDALPGQQEAA